MWWMLCQQVAAVLEWLYLRRESSFVWGYQVEWVVVECQVHVGIAGCVFDEVTVSGLSVVCSRMFRARQSSSSQFDVILHSHYPRYWCWSVVHLG